MVIDQDGFKELAEKVHQQKGVWRPKALEALSPKDGDFVTLVHGDPWFKNTLIK